jgi:hypothetical protein
MWMMMLVAKPRNGAWWVSWVEANALYDSRTVLAWHRGKILGLMLLSTPKKSVWERGVPRYIRQTYDQD